MKKELTIESAIEMMCRRCNQYNWCCGKNKCEEKPFLLEYMK